MIAVYTSARIGLLQDRQVLMVPVVLTEVLSDPKLPAEVSRTLSELPLIEVEPGIGNGQVSYGRRCAGVGLNCGSS